MKKPQSWRELLKKVIDDPQEKERIARQLGVNTLTLTRWVTQQSTPRPTNLTKLFNALRPQHSTQFRELVAEEFRSAAQTDQSEVAVTVPATFYAQLLNELAEMPKSQHTWNICNSVLHHALEQMDVYHYGMQLMIFLCTPPGNEARIRSLYISMNLGTAPWTGANVRQMLFFGAESLAGYVVATGHRGVVEDCSAPNERYLFRPIEGAGSLAAQPIKRFGEIAGCLWAASTQAGHFNAERLALLNQYADLIALAFNPEHFYDVGRVALGLMPPNAAQEPYCSTFWLRIAQVVRESTERGTPITNREAEQLVLQQLEDELLCLSSAR